MFHHSVVPLGKSTCRPPSNPKYILPLPSKIIITSLLVQFLQYCITSPPPLSSPACSPAVPAGCWHLQCQGAPETAVPAAEGQPLSCAGQTLSLPSCPVVCLRGAMSASLPLPHAGWKVLESELYRDQSNKVVVVLSNFRIFT